MVVEAKEGKRKKRTVETRWSVEARQGMWKRKKGSGDEMEERWRRERGGGGKGRKI